MKDFKIDRENKTFVFNDGEVLPIPKGKEKQVLRSKSGQQSKEQAQKRFETFKGNETLDSLVGSLSENYFGNLGDTAGNYVTSAIQSISPGEGQEEMSYRQRILDRFYAKEEARKEHFAELGKKNPIASGIGKGLGIAGELTSLYGVPGSVALPAMGAAHSETSFLEPVQKAKEVGKEALTGLILDKFFGPLGKLAGHRESQRGVRNLISEAEQKNAAEIARATGATEADKLRFANESASREAELGRLGQVQKTENQAFQAANNASAERVARTMGKQSLSNEILGVEDFINQSIDTSAHAATSEGNYAGKFLRSVFKGDKNGKLTGESLQRGIKALDEAIIKNEGTVKQLLIDYKNFMNQSLPNRLASNYVFEKWAPKILKGAEPLEKKLGEMFNSSRAINDHLIQRVGSNYIDKLNQGVNKSIGNVLNGFKNDFGQMDTAILRQEIANAVRSTPEYKKIVGRVAGMFPELKPEIAQIASPEWGVLKTSLEKYPEILAERITKNFNKYQADIGLDFTTKGGVTQKALEKAPVSPTLVPQPAQVMPAQITQPNLQQVPVMPQPQGMYGKLAQGLESLGSGMKNINTNSVMQSLPGIGLAKLAGVPLAKVAAGGAALATGAKALTSPTVAGQALRTGLEQGARLVSVIDSMAQKYPSYRDGVLEDPQERRSLTKEIEDNRQMSPEDKAVYQSKVNRGKPLQERL